MNKSLKVCLIVSAVIILLLPLGLLLGSVSLLIGDVWQSFFMPKDSLEHFIVCETRLPALITSILAGAALSSAGLMMQTSFSNPLAGPSIMGISTGSSLGVALVMMLFGGIAGALGRFAIIGGAFIGASAVLFILLFFSSVVRSSDALLIIGILIGYLSSSAISILNYFSVSESVHSFVLWGLGTFNNVDSDSLPLFALFCLILLFVSLLYAKSLNVLLFGTAYAESAGMSVKKARSGILLVAGALTALVTAYCGPIGFIGLIVPHVSRMLTGTSNHLRLMPANMLVGALTGLVCQMISVAPTFSYGGMLPVNAITPVLGVPVILYVILNRRKILYFN